MTMMECYLEFSYFHPRSNHYEYFHEKVMALGTHFRTPTHSVAHTHTDTHTHVLAVAVYQCKYFAYATLHVNCKWASVDRRHRCRLLCWVSFPLQQYAHFSSPVFQLRLVFPPPFSFFQALSLRLVVGKANTHAASAERPKIVCTRRMHNGKPGRRGNQG